MPRGVYPRTKLQKTMAIRFWSKVDIKNDDECWEWKASLDQCGYGQFRVNGIYIGAHRVAYELTYGKIEDNLCALHTCDNPPCCNPFHLKKGTRADNTNDMIIKGRWNGGVGSKNGLSKLTESDVIEIRHKRELGYTIISLADEYGVTHTSISRICLKHTWKHI